MHFLTTGVSPGMSDDPEHPNERSRGATVQRAQQIADPAPTDDVGAPSGDELLRVLADRRRRYVLQCLKTAKTPMALADLADDLVRWELDAEPTAVQDERERIYISLYHHHLPKLAEHDLVSFDLNQKLVSLGEAATDLGLGIIQTHQNSHPQNRP